MSCTRKEHERHIAEACEAFYDQNGDEDEWAAWQVEAHDALLARVDLEDGEIVD